MSAESAVEQLYGTWRLVSWTRHIVGTSETADPFGTAPHGFLTYGRDGRMSGMMVSEHRRKPTDLATLSDHERAELFKTVVAYGGTFKVVGDRVVHEVDISWNENWTGTSQVRTFRIDGPRLIINIDPQIWIDGRQSTAVLTFERWQ